MENQEKDFSFKIPAHPALLSKNVANFQRELEIFFSIPSAGINDETGLLLLAAGFGGNALSNVYKKMRRVFADTYNLITVQCNYLGYEFMQSPKPTEIQHALASAKILVKPETKIINIMAAINETNNNYVDMGPIQAMDCLTAVLAVTAVLEDNGHYINWGNSIAYGHSHGAYLAHLSNLFAPGLFNLLIDNSAWLSPVYLNSKRIVSYFAGEKTIQLIFDYLISKETNIDEQLYSLPYLYQTLDTDCAVIIYQGTTDNLVNYNEKRKLTKNIKNSTFNLIRHSDIDGEAFGSTNHGLSSDHLKLLDLAYNSFTINYPPPSIS